MAASGWRYLAERLNGDGTSEFLDLDLPLTEVQIDDVLSGDAGFNANITPEFERLKDSEGRPILQEWSTAIWAECDSQIRGGGILTDLTASGPTLGLECVGFTGYLKDMPYIGGIHFEETDALDIARHIWSHVQGETGGNLGLELDQRKSGVIIGSKMAQGEFDTENGPLVLEEGPYKLRWYQDHDLQSNFNDLAAETPFDYHERHEWGPDDKIHHYLDFGVPRLGGTNTGRFVLGENVFIVPTVNRTGADYASEVIALGAGEGARMVRGGWRSNTSRLRRVAVVSHPGLRKASAANSLAKRELQWRQDLDAVSDVIVRDTTHAPLGTVNVGDVIRLQGDTGWIELDATYRVLAITIQPEEADSMTLTIARTDRLAV